MYIIGFIVALIVVAIVSEWRKKRRQQEEQWRLLEVERLAREVIARGYANTKEEFLLVFPGACKICCERLLRVKSVTEVVSYGGPDFWSHGSGNCTNTYTCTRCGNTWENCQETSGEVWQGETNTEEKVRSPYLPYTPLTDSFPDFVGLTQS